jgi:energy-coupling factor transport system substrate-specific component
MFTVLLTVVYRVKALIPIYIYVMLNGVYAGFNAWWVPYLYIWTILWGLTMLLPRKMPTEVSAIVYPVLCAVHGFAYGTLYAPAQALMFDLSFDQMLIWIGTGIPFDIVHGIGNFVAGLLVLPLSRLLLKLENKKRI